MPPGGAGHEELSPGLRPSCSLPALPGRSATFCEPGCGKSGIPLRLPLTHGTLREVRFSFQMLREFLAFFFLCPWLDSRPCGEPDSVSQVFPEKEVLPVGGRPTGSPRILPPTLTSSSIPHLPPLLLVTCPLWPALRGLPSVTSPPWLPLHDLPSMTSPPLLPLRDLPSMAFPPDSPPPALWPPHPTSQSVAISLKFSWGCISWCPWLMATPTALSPEPGTSRRELLTDMQTHCPACAASGRHRWGGTSRKGLRKTGKGQAGEYTVTWVSSALTLRGLCRYHPAQVPG